MITRILGISCSPRHNSDSRAMLEHAIARVCEANGPELECNVIDLRDYRIEACNGCGVCGKTAITGERIDCVINDDVREVLEMMEEADGIVMSIPVKMSMLSDLFCRFMMRTRVLRNQDFKLANKPVGVMTVSRRRSGGGELAIMQAWMPFIRHGCLPVGAGGNASLHGAVGWGGSRNHILSDGHGLEQATNTVMRVIEVAKLVKAGRKILRHEHNMNFSYHTGSRL